MERRPLTPRQLLILVLTACRDAGQAVLPRKQVTGLFWELRTHDCPVVNNALIQREGQQRTIHEFDQALNGLHLLGVPFDAATGHVTVLDTLTTAEIYKPLYEKDRDRLAQEVNPYVSEYVRLCIRNANTLPAPKPDPTVS